MLSGMLFVRGIKNKICQQSHSAQLQKSSRCKKQPEQDKRINMA